MRLRKNKSLLLAEPAGSNKTVSKEVIVQLLRDVKDDISRTFPNSADRYQLVSRLMRGEYELYRLTKDPKTIADGYKYLQNNEMKLTDIFFSEIDFLALADYLDMAYRNSGEIKLAENALELTYRPYLRLRDTDNRWLYNKLVNIRINTLIDGYFTLKDYERMLYYITLNKSRMILEDKVRAEVKKSNILAVGADFFNHQAELPRFDAFQSKLKKASNYLDFYMNGHFETVAANDKQRIAKATKESSVAFAGTPAIKRGAVGAAESSEVFVTDSVYVSYVSNGKVQVTKLDDKGYLHQMQESLDEIYDNASDLDAATRGVKITAKSAGKARFSAFNITNELKLDLPESVTVSPDGWLSRYPFDWLLDRKTVRTLNLFTYGDTSKISGITVVGYFNPAINAPASPNNGDLPDAEKELDTLRPLLKNGTFYHRSDASIENLAKPTPRNILHLSMHGEDYSDDPIYSKLLFSGSTVGIDEASGHSFCKDDKKALYAKDMDRYSQLKDNDLVFTAACQTGLTKKSAVNQSEILGILRPLLINRNRNIILTLWPVESESAAQFVKTFYSNLAKSHDIKEAFFIARDVLKERYGHPAYWAPYYLVQSEQ